MSKLLEPDDSESNIYTPTELQASLLKGFVGFPESQADASESHGYPLTELQASLMKGFVGSPELDIYTPTELQASLLKGFVGFESSLSFDEIIMHQFSSSLFQWAKNLRPREFDYYINEIIDKEYAACLPNALTRRREKPVKEYLIASNEDSCDNRLAYILCSAQEKTGSLNILLIQHLTPLMLQYEPMPNIYQAIENGNFNSNIVRYTQSAVTFAGKGFIHLYSAEGMKLFYQTVYDWVEALPSAKFKGIMAAFLNEYDKQLWWGASRRVEVQRYLQYQSQAEGLALTFFNGKEGSIFNERLLQKIIETMKVDISKNGEKQSPGSRLILQYNPVEHNDLYIKELKPYAQERIHKQEHVSLTMYPN